MRSRQIWTRSGPFRWQLTTPTLRGGESKRPRAGSRMYLRVEAAPGPMTGLQRTTCIPLSLENVAGIARPTSSAMTPRTDQPAACRWTVRRSLTRCPSLTGVARLRWNAAAEHPYQQVRGLACHWGPCASVHSSASCSHSTRYSSVTATHTPALLGTGDKNSPCLPIAYCPSMKISRGSG